MRNTVTVETSPTFEQTMEAVTNAFDQDCEAVMAASPEPVAIVEGLCHDSVDRAIVLLRDSYPDTFGFFKGKDLEGGHTLIAQFIPGLD